MKPKLELRERNGSAISHTRDADDGSKEQQVHGATSPTSDGSHLHRLVLLRRAHEQRTTLTDPEQWLSFASYLSLQ